MPTEAAVEAGVEAAGRLPVEVGDRMDVGETDGVIVPLLNVSGRRHSKKVDVWVMGSPPSSEDGDVDTNVKKIVQTWMRSAAQSP